MEWAACCDREPPVSGGAGAQAGSQGCCWKHPSCARPGHRPLQLKGLGAAVATAYSLDWSGTRCSLFPKLQFCL